MNIIQLIFEAGQCVLLLLLFLAQRRAREPSSRALATVRPGQLPSAGIELEHLSSEVLDLVQSGSSAGVKEQISQAGHGFTAGEVIRCSETGTYVKAQGDSAANAEAVGVVESVNGESFTLVYSGRIVIAGAAWQTNAVYFLSADQPGQLSTEEPSAGVSKPMLKATGATSGIVLQLYGYEK